jgi:tetratricopeptide (TPR) repeat protein
VEAAGTGDLETAKRAAARFTALEPKNPDASFLAARLDLASEDPKAAVLRLEAMQRAGHKGYEIQIELSRAYDELGKTKERDQALERAGQADPSQVEPLYRLWHDAKDTKNVADEIRYLEKLAKLEQHAGPVYQRLMRLLVQADRAEEAVKWGHSALWADIEGAATHSAYAVALARVGRHTEAEFEFQSALLCPDAPPPLIQAHIEYFEYLKTRGKKRAAKELRDKAIERFPEVDLLKALTP